MIFIKLFINILKIFIHLGIHGDEIEALIKALESRFGDSVEEEE